MKSTFVIHPDAKARLDMLLQLGRQYWPALTLEHYGAGTYPIELSKNRTQETRWDEEKKRRHTPMRMKAK